MIFTNPIGNNNVFIDRQEAGKQLASLLEKYKGEDVIILALPRGGVEVAYEVAKKLNTLMDVIIVRKIGSPFNSEFAIGAIAENAVTLLNYDIIKQRNIPQSVVDKVLFEERKELQRRINLYRGKRSFPDLKGKTGIIVDDGLATGMTAQAAVKSANKFSPKKLIFAAPVCAKDSAHQLSLHVNAVECLRFPFNFTSIGTHYTEFSQTTDEKVIQLLKERRH